MSFGKETWKSGLYLMESNSSPFNIFCEFFSLKSKHLQPMRWPTSSSLIFAELGQCRVQPWDHNALLCMPLMSFVISELPFRPEEVKYYISSFSYKILAHHRLTPTIFAWHDFFELFVYILYRGNSFTIFRSWTMEKIVKVWYNALLLHIFLIHFTLLFFKN